MNKKIELYKIDEVLTYKFIQMPKILFVGYRYKELNIVAKIIYSLLLDRMSLSRKNNWVNKEGEIYLIFSRENLSQILNVSKPTVTSCMKELKKLDLIKEERMGRGRLNLIYIGKIIPDDEEIKKLKSLISRSKNSLSLEVKNLYPNYTNINNTNIKYAKEKYKYKDYEQRQYGIGFLESFYDNL
jgi:DNA-binding transcriptional ArsR family regulator